jgi:hypothetical protein
MLLHNLSFSFLRVAWRYRQSLVQYGACAPSHSKIDTEVMLLARSRMRIPRTVSRVPHAFITLHNSEAHHYYILNYSWGTHAGQIRVHEQTRVTLKTPWLRHGAVGTVSTEELEIINFINTDDRPLRTLLNLRDRILSALTANRISMAKMSKGLKDKSWHFRRAEKLKI